jgi:hypothetical protein
VRIHAFIKETDIRILTYVPPFIGLIAFLIAIFVMSLLTGQSSQHAKNFLAGTLSFLLCFSGYSQIYKKEMPGLLGGVYKGNWAVVSGVIIVLVFGMCGLISLFYGVTASLR